MGPPKVGVYRNLSEQALIFLPWFLTEFRVFVEAAERQLLLLFRSIDRDHDGRVGRGELTSAFQKANIAVPKSRLVGFFDEVDMNRDGYISFDEWRYAPPNPKPPCLSFTTALNSYMPFLLCRYLPSSFLEHSQHHREFAPLVVSQRSLQQKGKAMMASPSVCNDNKRVYYRASAQLFRSFRRLSILSKLSDIFANGCPSKSDFLLFMPQKHGSPLEAALSFYSSIVSLNAEGDSMVTEETLEGIGTTGSIFQALFGAILKLAEPPPPGTIPPPPATLPLPGSGIGSTNSSTPCPDPTTQERQPPTSSELKPPLHPNLDPAAKQTNEDAMAAAYAHYPQAAAGSVSNAVVATTTAIQQATVPGGVAKNDQFIGSGTYEQSGRNVEFLDTDDHEPQLDLHEVDMDDEVSSTGLTQYLPEPGYFVAGALAGGISRTATAPLDRLKVYLLVNTKAKTDAAIDVVKKGKGLASFRQAGKPITEAVRDLYRAGGFRTFFAGTYIA